MKLDYFDLISPFPLEIEEVGSIVSPTLKEIADISYYLYGAYVSVLSLTPEKYFEKIEKITGKKIEAETISKTTKYDLLLIDTLIRKDVERSLNFFFIEDVVFNDSDQTFYVIKRNDKEDTGTIVGIINKDNYKEIVDIILQRLHIDIDKDEIDDLSKVTNIRGKKIYEKILKGRKKMQEAKKKESNSDYTLPNIISSVAAYSNNINYTQIWDLTIYQLFDLFDRLQLIDQYDISRIQVSVWGDEKNQFKLGLWKKNLYEKEKEES